MEWKMALTIFSAVFVAELGDKTQLATLLFATDGNVSKWLVFVAASLALVASVAVAVLLGGVISQYLSEHVLHYLAGVGFVLIGLWMLYSA